MCARASVDSEHQDATKITSALADARICPFTEMMTLYMYILVIKNFLNVLPSFFPSVVTMSTSRPADVAWQTIFTYQGPSLEDHDRPIDSEIVVTRKKSDATLNLKVMTIDGLVQRTIGVLCSIYHIIFHWSITGRIHGTRWRSLSPQLNEQNRSRWCLWEVNTLLSKWNSHVCSKDKTPRE